MKSKRSHSGVIGIYIIVNSVTGQRYIGSSLDVGGRITRHLVDLRAHRHSNRHLQEDWDRFGPSVFSYHVACQLPDRDFDRLYELETSYFWMFYPNVYNVNHPTRIVLSQPRLIQLSLKRRLDFETLIDRSDMSGCWVYTGRKDKGGYGDFAGYRAHRVAYYLANDEQPGPLCVCHTCDNPSCVRPDHLFLGTHDDNAKDRNSKGRTAGRNRKMTWDKVREIRRLWCEGGLTCRELDRMFDYTSCHPILSNRTWYDPDYVPPSKECSPVPHDRQVTITAFGETKTAKEWVADSRCEVTLPTLRKKVRAGFVGEHALCRTTPGPHGPREPKIRELVIGERERLIIAMDANGEWLRSINIALASRNMKRSSEKEIMRLTEGRDLTAEEEDRMFCLCGGGPGKPPVIQWTYLTLAREIGVPTSVMTRYWQRQQAVA